MYFNHVPLLHGNNSSVFPSHKDVKFGIHMRVVHGVVYAGLPIGMLSLIPS